MTLPKHTNPAPHRRAKAPYNFVPLPEEIIPAEEPPAMDRYHPDLYSGWLECKLTNDSPLYIRAGLTEEEARKIAEIEQEAAKQGNEVRILPRPDFFFLDPRTCEPVIPGSSLRGMFRTLIEIITYSKVQPVTDKQLFFRTVDNTSVGGHYRERMVGKVKGGFLRRHKDGSYYIKPCTVLRVSRKALPKNLYSGKGPNKIPNWDLQYSPVWVDPDAGSSAITQKEQVSMEEQLNWRRGILVITGDVPRKQEEFIFLEPEGDDEIKVEDTLIKRFHDDDQITRWQRLAFPKDKPEAKNRRRAGELRKAEKLSPPPTPRFGGRCCPGDPVFFLMEKDKMGKDKLTFFGRAQMFRLPYEHSPRDFVPTPDQDDKKRDYDIAEALFGHVERGDPRPPLAGRLFFSDARCLSTGGQETQEARPCTQLRWSKETNSVVWEESEAEDGHQLSPCSQGKELIVPRILASPKPTTFQHYLVQDKDRGHDPDDKEKLAHYGTPTPDETVIRGHKLYWHKGEIEIDDLIENQEKFGKPEELMEEVKKGKDTQHTRIRPLEPGACFHFRIDFENLRKEELGALLWLLEIAADDRYRLKLGMGKPLGMGAVKITSTLHLINREARYKSLFNKQGNAWDTGERVADDEKKDIIQAFEKAIIEALGYSPEYVGLRTLLRIRDLLCLLSWEGPKARYTAYLNFPQGFKNRPVLPTPEDVHRDCKKVYFLRMDGNRRYFFANPGEIVSGHIKERREVDGQTYFTLQVGKKHGHGIAKIRARVKGEVNAQIGGYLTFKVITEDGIAQLEAK